MNIYGISINKRKAIIVTILVIIVGLCIVGVDVYYSFFTPEKIKTNQIKQQVSKKIGRTNFTIQSIIVQTQGWELAQIVSTASADKGNPAYVILQQENGQMVLKFGPGTNFSKVSLGSAGVPLAIENALFGTSDDNLDPIVSHLPYTTNFYSVTYAGKLSSPGGENEQLVQRTLLTVTIYIAPRFGITDTPQREAQYKAEIDQWIQSLGLDPSNYKMIFTT